MKTSAITHQARMRALRLSTVARASAVTTVRRSAAPIAVAAVSSPTIRAEETAECRVNDDGHRVLRA